MLARTKMYFFSSGLRAPFTSLMNSPMGVRGRGAEKKYYLAYGIRDNEIRFTLPLRVDIWASRLRGQLHCSPDGFENPGSAPYVDEAGDNGAEDLLLPGFVERLHEASHADHRAKRIPR